MSIITNPYLRILHEITKKSNYIPKKEEYVAWYETHYKTIAQQPYNDFLMPEIIWAFNEFKTLVGFLDQESLIIEANNRFRLLDQENDEKVIGWLLEHEKLSEVVAHFYCLHFEWFDDKIEGNKIIVCKELGIKIELSDFKEFLDFEKAYTRIQLKHKKKNVH